MSWNTVYNLYAETESLVCSKNCLEADDQPPDGLEHTHISNNIKSDNLSLTPDKLSDNSNLSSVPKVPEYRVTPQPFRLIPINRK
jgi:hypothetical protein